MLSDLTASLSHPTFRLRRKRDDEVMESEEARLRGMIEAGLRLLEVACAQDPAMPPHILAAIEETYTDLRARLSELSAGSHDT